MFQLSKLKELLKLNEHKKTQQYQQDHDNTGYKQINVLGVLYQVKSTGWVTLCFKLEF
jgi:hypothetical protein